MVGRWILYKVVTGMKYEKEINDPNRVKECANILREKEKKGLIIQGGKKVDKNRESRNVRMGSSNKRNA